MRDAGFAARGTNPSLENHLINPADGSSAFVATSKFSSVGIKFGKFGETRDHVARYATVFVIRNDGTGADVQETFRSSRNFPDAIQGRGDIGFLFEVAFPAAIPASSVVAVDIYTWPGEELLGRWWFDDDSLEAEENQDFNLSIAAADLGRK